METHEKIRLFRELNQWSQEEVAEKLAMSAGGYAKIERGETQLSIARLQQLSKIFNIDMLELLRSDKGGFAVQINEVNEGENSGGDFSIYHASDAVKIQLLEQQLKHCQEMLQQKEIEIELLRKVAGINKK